MAETKWRVPARIETERLVLRRLVADDAEQLTAVIGANIAHLERYMAWAAYEPQPNDKRREWIAHANAEFDAGIDYTLGIFDRQGAYIGGTGFHVRTDPDRLEIGYWIAADREGQGLVTEAAAALTRVALEYSRAPIVGISCVPTNTRSSAIPRRLGFEAQDLPGEDCFEGGESATSEMWWANRDTLLSEPLASTPRPAIFDSHGSPLAWLE